MCQQCTHLTRHGDGARLRLDPTLRTRGGGCDTADQPIPATLRRAATLPKHRRPNNAVELRVQTEKSIVVKKLTHVAKGNGNGEREAGEETE